MCPLLAQLEIGFFSSFSAAAVYSTNEANKAGLKQSIIFRCLCSDDIIVTSQIYKFHSHIVVPPQSINKKFGAPTPSCFVYKHTNAQPY
jgi:hypothetical protein